MKFASVKEAKWSARGILTHHRQQEASSPQNAVREMMIIEGIGIAGMMFEDKGDEVALAA